MKVNISMMIKIKLIYLE